jgi:hypothetical protein
MLDYADVDSLRGFEFPETALVDFKGIDVLRPVSGKSVADEVTPDLCALANAGGGRLIFGAETNKGDRLIQRLRGMPESDLRAALSRLRSSGHSSDPPVALEMKAIQVPKRDEFLIVVESVPTEHGPHQYKGVYHFRSADAKRPMSHSMVVAELRKNIAKEATFGATDLRYPDPLYGNPFEDAVFSLFLGVRLHPHVPLSAEFCDPGDPEQVKVLREAIAKSGRDGGHANRWSIPYRSGLLRQGRVNFYGNAHEVWTLMDEDGAEGLALGECRVESLEESVATMIQTLGTMVSALAPTLRMTVRARLWWSSANGVVVVRGAEMFHLRKYPVVEGGEVLGDALAGDLASEGGPAEAMAKRFGTLVPAYGSRIRRTEAPKRPAPRSWANPGPGDPGTPAGQ